MGAAIDTGFATLKSVSKMSARGYECPNCKMPMMMPDEGIMPTMSCMNCGATSIAPARKRVNPFSNSSKDTREEWDKIMADRKVTDQRLNDDLLQSLKDSGTTVVPHPKQKVDFDQRKPLSELTQMLNLLGFTSITELMQEYMRLKIEGEQLWSRKNNNDEHADEMVRSHMEHRNEIYADRFKDPFLSWQRGKVDETSEVRSHPSPVEAGVEAMRKPQPDLLEEEEPEEEDEAKKVYDDMSWEDWNRDGR